MEGLLKGEYPNIEITRVMRGSVVGLVEESQITGTDTFTNKIIGSFTSPVDTSLPLDEGIREGDGVAQ